MLESGITMDALSDISIGTDAGGTRKLMLEDMFGMGKGSWKICSGSLSMISGAWEQSSSQTFNWVVESRGVG